MSLFKRNVTLMLVCLMITGIFGTAVSTETVSADSYRDLPTLIYNHDGIGSRISAAMVDDEDWNFGGNHDSHIWFGDISKYKTGAQESHTGDAFWRVVDRDQDYNGTGGGRMWLVSEFTWNGKCFHTDEMFKEYHKTIFQKTFSEQEKNAIMKNNNTGRTGEFQYYPPTWMESTSNIELTDDNKLFSLSAREIKEQFDKQPGAHKGSNSKTNADSAAYASYRALGYPPNSESSEEYWLRERGWYMLNYMQTYVRREEGWGFVDRASTWKDYALNIRYMAGYAYALRPGFNLDLTKVIFASTAKDSDGPKAGATGSLHAVGTFEKNPTKGESWKLTILDENRTLTVNNAQYTDDSKNTLKVTYSNATTGYISAIILDEDSKVKYYGRVYQIDRTNSSGSFYMDLTDVDTTTTDKLYLFSEQYNGDYLTDYASKPQPVEIEMKQSFPIVTFDKGNEQATGITTSIYLQKDEEVVTLPKCGYEMPAETSLAFLGWKKQGRTTRFLPGEEVTINSDTTFTAEWGKSWQALQDKIDAAADGGTVLVDDDYYAAEGDVWLIIPEGKNITIDLNGHRVDRNAVPSTSVLDTQALAVDKGSVFLVSGPGTTLTIKDSVGGGTLTGGCARPQDEKITGGAITVWDGATVNFNGGTITNNYSEFVGGVLVEKGTFNFNGGTITQNNGLIAGAVLVINREGTAPVSTFTMTGGEIVSNYNKGFGSGGVTLYGGVTGNFKGGKISSNVGIMAGGVLMFDYEGAKPTINVSGSPVIYRNVGLAQASASDLVIYPNDIKINVIDGLSKDAKIGVYTTDKPTERRNLQITEGLNGKGSIDNFVSTDQAYIVMEGSAERVEVQGEAYLSKKVELVYYEDETRTKKIETVPTFTEKLITLPQCKVTKPGKNFVNWTIVAVPDLADDMTINAEDYFYVVRNFINSDRQVIIYANWADHVHDLQHVDATAPKCETDGNIEYWRCDGCNKYFSDAQGENEITLEETVVDAIGHDYGTPAYTWSDDNMSITAERICNNDSSHKDQASGTVVSERTLEPGCETKGQTTYTATFSKEGYTTQTKTLENIDALGHNWGAWVITTPPGETTPGVKTRTCLRNSDHIETAPVPPITHEHDYKEVAAVERTCEKDGNVKYWICDGCGMLFLKDENNNWVETTESEVILHATGHIYGAPVYVWSENHDSVTATVTCRNNEQHKITETHTSTETEDEGKYKIRFEQIGNTCTENGRDLYIATFKDTAHFSTEIASILTDPPTGHEWGPLIVDQDPTCKEPGKGHHVCKHDTAHIKPVDIPKTDHEWVVDEETAYVWADDLSSVTATATCKNNCGETLTETKATTTRIIKPATDFDEGIIEYRATFDNLIFADQTRTASIPKKLAVTFMVNNSVYAKTLVDRNETVERPEDPTKVCYDFAGWYLDGVEFDFDTQITSNLTLYAEFTPKVYTITYNLNGGELPEGYPTEYTIESDDIHFPSEYPTRAHHLFLGWTGTDLAGETKDVVIEKGSFGNRVYNAIFEIDSKEVTVTLDPKGGELAEKSVVVNTWLPYGTLPVPTVTQKDVVFDAWYTSEDFAEGTRIDAGTVVSIEEDHTIYARYMFAVYFEGSDTPIEPVYVYTDLQDKRISKPEQIPQKGDYNFDYWAKADEKPFDFANEQASPGLTLRAMYYRYASTINNNVWILHDSGKLRFRFVRYQFMISEKESDKDLKKDFEQNDKQVFVDDVLLAADQYTYDNGSLIVNLKDSYLNTLAIGQHKIRVEFTDGTVSTEFTVKERSKPSSDKYIYPKTGIE